MRRKRQSRDADGDARRALLRSPRARARRGEPRSLPQQALHRLGQPTPQARAQASARPRPRRGARRSRASKVDHVVITGDLTNLALEQEFDAVKKLIEERARPRCRPPHDRARQPRPLHARRDAHRSASPSSSRDYLESDLPDLAADISLGRFPIVKLRGPDRNHRPVERGAASAAHCVGRARGEADRRARAHPRAR